MILSNQLPASKKNAAYGSTNSLNTANYYCCYYSRQRFSAAFVCLCVCFSAQYSKTAAARITKLDTEILHHESWKPI